MYGLCLTEAETALLGFFQAQKDIGVFHSFKIYATYSCRDMVKAEMKVMGSMGGVQ